MGHRPLPAVRDLTRDVRWSTYDVSVLKKMGVKMRTDRKPSKATITNKTSPAGSFSSSQPGGPPCRPGVLCIYLFSALLSFQHPSAGHTQSHSDKCGKFPKTTCFHIGLCPLPSSMVETESCNGPYSVADPNTDPDPPDPHAFGPPGSGSGSISQRYGCGSESGSFYHQAKKVRKTLIPTAL